LIETDIMTSSLDKFWMISNLEVRVLTRTLARPAASSQGALVGSL
jgi:hypothetical protein